MGEKLIVAVSGSPSKILLDAWIALRAIEVIEKEEEARLRHDLLQTHQTDAEPTREKSESIGDRQVIADALAAN